MTTRRHRFRAWPTWAHIALGATAGGLITAGIISPAATTNEVATPRPAVGTTRPTVAVVPSVPVDILPAGDDATVLSITDGDTLRVVDGRAIRLIGIDAPETSGGAQCYAAESSARLRSLVPTGTAVRLAYDKERLDRYGRTLAYVYRLSDGLFVNLAMVRDGSATNLTIRPNTAHSTQIKDAVAEAKAAGLGRWGACVG